MRSLTTHNQVVSERWRDDQVIHLNDRLDIDETRVAMSMRIYFRSSLARPRQFHYRVIHIAKVSAAWISLKKESYAQEAEAGNQKKKS